MQRYSNGALTTLYLVRTRTLIAVLERRLTRKCMSKEAPNLFSRSHLFTLRIWQEEIDADKREWRGKVQLFPSGEVRYFREWDALTPLLLTMLSNVNSDIEES